MAQATRTRRTDQTQLPLPLWETAVFFDWYGTLSTSRFWEGITESATHPLAPRLSAAVTDLFVNQKDLLARWMRGHLTDEEVCDTLNVPLPRSYRPDFLRRSLLEDCRTAAIDPDMLAIATDLRHTSYIAVASDNMSCFAEAPPAVLYHGLRIDDLLVSSEIGALKSEDPHAFFEPFLTERGLTFNDAVLIDDCAQTCDIFSSLGGTGIHFTTSARLRHDIADWISR